MSKFVVMTVSEVEADDLDAAKTKAELNASTGSVVHVADSLSGMLNPFHWADAQNTFGHIQPAKQEEAPNDTVDPAAETTTE